MSAALYGGVAVVLVIAVVAVAYGSQAPSFAVAEFAPAARNQPAAPPTTAASAASSRSGGAGRATTTTTPIASATTGSTTSNATVSPTTRVGRSRQCYGDPPRQTEDPMAPACLATIFEGDNGGATSRGVSSTEIRVAVPIYGSGVVNVQSFDALFEFFNQRFEFYGRRLVPIYLDGATTTPLQARTVAATAGAANVFGALAAVPELVNGHSAFPLELAREGVVTVVRGAAMGWTDRTMYDAAHPLIWSVYPSAEDVQANLANFACTALAGRVARFAGDPTMRTTTRRFGIVAAAEVTPPGAGVLARALEDCTGTAPVRVDVAGSAAHRAAMEKLRAQGVTTVFCICEDDHPYFAHTNANTIGFYPEWVLGDVVTYPGCEYECEIQRAVRDSHMAPPMMVSAGPRALPIQARPWFGPVASLFAQPGASFITTARVEQIYASLLVLASGIQSAGPTLTSDTFAQGLMTTTFPNPEAGRAPYWQPSAGFGPGDHSFYDDYSVGWWSEQADAMEQSQGARPKGSWCYLSGAARFQVGRYPADAESQLFNADLPCR